MTTEFLTENVVSPELAAVLMKLAPANPFCTASFAAAQRADGREPWLLGIKRSGTLIAACYGFLAPGRLNSTLEIRSLPDLPWDDGFWNGLLRFCSAHRITYLQLDTSGAPHVRIPSLPGEVERQSRCDFILDLRNPEWERKLAPKHRQSIRRAVQAGVTIRRTSSAAACRDHVRLRNVSMKRRHQLGELTPSDVEEGFPSARLLTEKGAGELFQAVVGGTALSSVLVLKAAEGASGDSGGTSPEGLKCGASPFLLYSICRALREESIWTFNFGPAEPNTSMSLFKKHFGTTTVPLEFAKFYLGSEFRRKLTDAVRLIRQTKSAISPRTGPDSR